MHPIVRPLNMAADVGYDASGQLCSVANENGVSIIRYPFDCREQLCEICGRGWLVTPESLRDQLHIETFQKWRHMTCHVRVLALSDRNLFHEALVRNKICFSKFIEIPSQYWLRDEFLFKRSWFIAEEPRARFGIHFGSRKHVYHLSFQAYIDRELSHWKEAGLEFQKDNVTKEFTPTRVLLHCWGAEEFHKTFDRLAKVFGLSKKT